MSRAVSQAVNAGHRIRSINVRICYYFAAFMQRVHHTIRKSIFSVLDIFYPIFRRFMPLQTYHYAACGGSNTLLSLIIFTSFHNFVFNTQVVHFGGLAFESYTAALFVAFSLTFPIGFYLSMFVVFQGSYLRKRIQLFRYFLVAISCIFLNYIFLKFFVGNLGWYPTPSQILTTAIVILFSYFTQRHFSFKAGSGDREMGSNPSKTSS